MRIPVNKFIPRIKINNNSSQHTFFTAKDIPCDSFTRSVKDTASEISSSESHFAHAVLEAAKTVSNDKDVQKALVEMAVNEAVVIRTKEDAIPVLKKIYTGISEADKKNLVVLDINPQKNNRMPKSNHLISEWFIEANGLSNNQLITLTDFELEGKKFVKPEDLCESWKQGSPIAKKIQRIIGKFDKNPEKNMLTVPEAKTIIENTKNLIAQGKIYSINENTKELEQIAQAINKINKDVISPIKNGSYADGLASQLKDAVASSVKEQITVVIPDDCSLSGSSMLCDTAKILEKVFDGTNSNKKVNVIFSPMIIGEKAKEAFKNFISPDFKIDNTFLKSGNALCEDGTEELKNAKQAFDKIRGKENITFKVSDEAINAVHFTNTATYKKIGEENPVLQQQLLYIMRGPMLGKHALFGGFGDCGVMVITPTAQFTLNGRNYAGKIPTNSVGYMEILGHKLGVLNDQAGNGNKGIFTKGTGIGYNRYCEWDELNHPSKYEDRIPIEIENGVVHLKRA